MQQYNVTGMSCAACSARVEKAVNAVPGVTSCSVSLLTNSMGVEGTANADEIIKAIEDAGYGASLKGAAGTTDGQAGGNDGTSDMEDALKDTETPKLKRRLIFSLGFLAVLMYISMGHSMWGWPLPAFLDGNYIAIGVLQMILSAIVMVINQKFFINGFKGLIHKSPNMDTLVALGSSASFGYSVYVLYAMTEACLAGDTHAAMHYSHEFYFESAAMILALITVGKMLEARSKGKTTDALKSLMKLAPKTATLIVDGAEKVVSADAVKIGDVFVVKPGESIPVDGIIIDGEAAIDESALTGESIPVDKTVGAGVSAATINTSGFIKCEARRVGQDTTLSQIIQMVSNAAATKAPIAKVADKVSGVFVPVVITIAIVTMIVWLLLGETVGFAIARGISVLVISCPCALGLATPVAIMVGNGVGAKNGILFKTAVSLENAGKSNIVVLDKTGTITKGEPKVTDIIPNKAHKISENELLQIAYSMEKMSEHPLAKAVVSEGESKGVKAFDLTGFKALPGNGLTAELITVRTASDGVTKVASKKMHLFAGNLKFISEKVTVSDEMLRASEELASRGKTPLFFAKGNELLGIIAVADVIKEESPRAISELKNMGIRVVMLTGDNEKTATAIGKQAGVDEVIASVLPEGKESVVRSLKEEGTVIMVGDGINDAPALTTADTGIAIGAGADVAIDAADIVLVNSKLSDVPAAIRLSRQTLKNIHENLFWAFIYNIIGIPLAAGAFIGLFGWELNPMFGAAAMSLSSFCVVSNALRLNLFDIRSTKKDRKIHAKNKAKTKVNKQDIQAAENKNDLKEMKSMEKTMKIEGMMCPHCEANVKGTLEAFAEVDEAVVSHEAGTAVLKLNADISDDVLKEAIEAKGYKVL